MAAPLSSKKVNFCGQRTSARGLSDLSAELCQFLLFVAECSIAAKLKTIFLPISPLSEYIVTFKVCTLHFNIIQHMMACSYVTIDLPA